MQMSRQEKRHISDTAMYQKVNYAITAIEEAPFKAFIKEYKAGYGKEDFDMTAHFKRRKEATLTREVTHYFEVSALQ